MKKLVLCGLALLGSVAAHAQLTPLGGPDAFGYTWKTSAATGGPIYRWVDIRTRGTRVQGLEDDNLAPTPVVIPFDFPYYLRSFNTVRIASNGYLAFTYPGGPAPAALAQPFPAIPTPSDPHRAYLAGYLADLNFSTAGANAANPAQCYYMANNDSLVVTYINVPFWERAAAGLPDFRGANTFQIILARADSAITFQYQDMDPTLPVPMPPSSGPSRVGIEDLTGTLGLEPGVDQIPTNGSAIRFTPPAAATTFRFTDVASNGFNNPDGAAFFAVLGQPLPIRASFSNSGNTNVGAFTVTSRITNRPGFPTTQLNNQTAMVPRLRAQQDTLVTFANTYTPSRTAPSAGTGAFKVVNTVQLTGDQFPLNNTKTSMFVVVDTANVPEVVLSYDDEPFSRGFGLAGAGVYFQPPFYPAELRATETTLLTAPGAPAPSGVKIKVYADNGPNGAAGTLLYSDSIAQANITTGALNTLNITPPVRITSGGFYISWIPDSATAMTVAEHTPPVGGLSARRSFEVSNGAFSPYRSSDVNILITATIATRVVTGIGEDRTGQLALAPAFPNPAADRTTLSFSLRHSAPTNLVVRDLMGRAVRTVALGTLGAGDQRYELNTAALAAGVYTYSLTAGSVQLTRKLLVQR